LWSDRLVAHQIANAPEFHFAQEVFHGELQGLDYDLDDTHTLTPHIKQDIEFQRGINVKLKPGKFLGTELISSVWTLKTNTC
jgi:hypothetical protein